MAALNRGTTQAGHCRHKVGAGLRDEFARELKLRSGPAARLIADEHERPKVRRCRAGEAAGPAAGAEHGTAPAARTACRPFTMIYSIIDYVPHPAACQC